MAKLFSLFRRTRRRIKSGLLDHSTFKLYEAAGRLLRDHDHEQMSVAQLTRVAGVSVGAFYRRYRDKDAFLRMVVAEYLYSTRNRMERALARERWAGQPSRVVTRAIVEQLMRDLQGSPGAGIVRTALKRGPSTLIGTDPLLLTGIDPVSAHGLWSIGQTSRYPTCLQATIPLFDCRTIPPPRPGFRET